MKPKKLLYRVFAFISPFLIIFYLIMQLSTRFSQGMSTEYVLKAEMEETIDASAYIMRNETLLYTQESGVFYNLGSEGQKGSARTPVVAVYTDSPELNIQDRIRSIEEKIKALEASSVDTSYMVADISSLDNSIYENILYIKKNLSAGKTLLALQKRSSLLTMMNKRQLMVKEVAGFEYQIQQLKTEKDTLYHSLVAQKDTVYASKSGYFSSQIDGYESVFAPSALETMTVGGFYDALNQKTSTQGVAGKIITDYIWYVLCPVSKENSYDFKEENEYNIVFPYSDSISLPGKLTKKIAESGQENLLLIFEMTSVPNDFDFTRAQSVQLQKATYKGYRIQKNAIRYVDGKEGVYILAGNTVRFRTIHRLYESGGYCIVIAITKDSEHYADSLHLHDTVLIGGKDLYDGKTIT
ncbi:MAG TPA: hypothetical protein DER23_04805 [Clostridiales bacterium]|nr:hypothetical protein [Clostridiales bacterium]